jgi:hypothetical protein
MSNSHTSIINPSLDLTALPHSPSGHPLCWTSSCVQFNPRAGIGIAIVKLEDLHLRRDIAGGIDHAFVTPPATGALVAHVRPEIFNNHNSPLCESSTGDAVINL